MPPRSLNRTQRQGSSPVCCTGGPTMRHSPRWMLRRLQGVDPFFKTVLFHPTCALTEMSFWPPVAGTWCPALRSPGESQQAGRFLWEQRPRATKPRHATENTFNPFGNIFASTLGLLLNSSMYFRWLHSNQGGNLRGELCLPGSPSLGDPSCAVFGSMCSGTLCSGKRE